MCAPGDISQCCVPGAANQARPASGASLIGGQSGDSASETMAKRLAHKLGHPVFVSISIRDDVELRAWAERQALMALIKGRGGAAPLEVGFSQDLRCSRSSAQNAPGRGQLCN